MGAHGPKIRCDDRSQFGGHASTIDEASRFGKVPDLRDCDHAIAFSCRSGSTRRNHPESVFHGETDGRAAADGHCGGFGRIGLMGRAR
jgi:hypothetical protein